MNEQEMGLKLAALEEKIDKIYVSTEKTRMYFKWTLIISVGLVVLPAIGLLLAIPALISTMSATTLGTY